MNFAEVMDQLPKMIPKQRQALIKRAVEIDERPRSNFELRLVEERLLTLRSSCQNTLRNEMGAGLRAKFFEMLFFFIIFARFCLRPFSSSVSPSSTQRFNTKETKRTNGFVSNPNGIGRNNRLGSRHMPSQNG